ncbi:MAG: cytidine deaminase, partial [Inhella sp.]
RLWIPRDASRRTDLVGACNCFRRPSNLAKLGSFRCLESSGGTDSQGRSAMTIADPLKTQMLAVARSAREAAYAPYSKYTVGAALLADNGQVFGGCNVENAAYPEGVCAEAGAISAMVLAGMQRAKAVLVVGGGAHQITPCGGCRQKLREFCDPKSFTVLAINEDGQQQQWTLEELLPGSFGPHHLSI